MLHHDGDINILHIHEAIRNTRVKITDHADEEVHNDQLTLDEVLDSVLYGEIIETYPLDRPYPSCLIYGVNACDDPIHSVWAYNCSTLWAVLITVYRPDPARWIGWKFRRKQ